MEQEGQHQQQKTRLPTSAIVAGALAIGAALETIGDRATAAWSANELRTNVPAFAGSVGSERTWQVAVLLLIVGVLLLIARQRASDRIGKAVGEHGLKLVRGFGLLALILAAYMGVLSQTGFHEQPPTIRAEVPQRSTAYPTKKPSGTKFAGGDSTGGGKAEKVASNPVVGDLTASAEPNPKPRSICLCGQKPSSQRSSKPTPSGGSTSSKPTHETQATTAKTKEASVNEQLTKTENRGGSGSAEVKGAASSEREISGGAGTSRSEIKSSSTTSSTSTENGSTQSAESHSAQESKTESSTRGTPSG